MLKKELHIWKPKCKEGRKEVGQSGSLAQMANESRSRIQDVNVYSHLLLRVHTGGAFRDIKYSLQYAFGSISLQVLGTTTNHSS